MIEKKIQRDDPCVNPLFLEKAAQLEPKLFEWNASPLREVRFCRSKTAWQNISVRTRCTADETLNREYRTGDRFILDFGETGPGHLEFSIDMPKAHNDSPVQLLFIFAEFPLEIAKEGQRVRSAMNSSWIQREIVTADDLPATIRLSRRYQMRYLLVEVLGTPAFGLRFRKIVFHRCSAVSPEKAVPPAGTSRLMRKIDEICLRTLRNCMQTVFEDGPKRDRRLWLGDLRLQAKINACTCRNFDGIEHCMYLLAAFSDPRGMISSDCYERPVYAGGKCFISDYALLFADLLLDHYKNTGRLSVVRDLYPIAEKQFRICREYVHRIEPIPAWNFIDWCDTLDRTTPECCVYVYGLRKLTELADAAGFPDRASAFRDELEFLCGKISSVCYDPRKELFVSGEERQISYASQIWAVLSGIVTGEKARHLLEKLRETPEAVKPVTPYLQHHYAEAMLTAGMEKEAMAFIRSYWGAMVKAGMDVCPEVFVPEKPFLSPYGDARLNSACHAWSCGASYFLRKKKHAAQASMLQPPPFLPRSLLQP